MTQHELDSAVALVTGEEIDEIQHIGFSLADPDDTDFDPEPDDRPPQPIDGNHTELERHLPCSIQEAA